MGVNKIWVDGYRHKNDDSLKVVLLYTYMCTHVLYMKS